MDSDKIQEIIKAEAPFLSKLINYLKKQNKDAEKFIKLEESVKRIENCSQFSTLKRCKSLLESLHMYYDGKLKSNGGIISKNVVIEINDSDDSDTKSDADCCEIRPFEIFDSTTSPCPAANLEDLCSTTSSFGATAAITTANLVNTPKTTFNEARQKLQQMSQKRKETPVQGYLHNVKTTENAMMPKNRITNNDYISNTCDPRLRKTELQKANIPCPSPISDLHQGLIHKQSFAYPVRPVSAKNFNRQSNKIINQISSHNLNYGRENSINRFEQNFSSNSVSRNRDTRSNVERSDPKVRNNRDSNFMGQRKYWRNNPRFVDFHSAQQRPMHKNISNRSKKYSRNRSKRQFKRNKFYRAESSVSRHSNYREKANCTNSSSSENNINSAHSEGAQSTTKINNGGPKTTTSLGSEANSLDKLYRNITSDFESNESIIKYKIPKKAESGITIHINDQNNKEATQVTVASSKYSSETHRVRINDKEDTTKKNKEKNKNTTMEKCNKNNSNNIVNGQQNIKKSAKKRSFNGSIRKNINLMQKQPNKVIVLEHEVGLTSENIEVQKKSKNNNEQSYESSKGQLKHSKEQQIPHCNKITTVSGNNEKDLTSDDLKIKEKMSAVATSAPSATLTETMSSTISATNSNGNLTTNVWSEPVLNALDMLRNILPKERLNLVMNIINDSAKKPTELANTITNINDQQHQATTSAPTETEMSKTGKDNNQIKKQRRVKRSELDALNADLANCHILSYSGRRKCTLINTAESGHNAGLALKTASKNTAKRNHDTAFQVKKCAVLVKNHKLPIKKKKIELCTANSSVINKADTEANPEDGVLRNKVGVAVETGVLPNKAEIVEDEIFLNEAQAGTISKVSAEITEFSENAVKPPKIIDEPLFGGMKIIAVEGGISLNDIEPDVEIPHTKTESGETEITDIEYNHLYGETKNTAVEDGILPNKDKPNKTTTSLPENEILLNETQAEESTKILEYSPIIKEMKNIDRKYHSMSEYTKYCIVCNKKPKAIQEHYITKHNEYYPARLPPNIVQALNRGLGSKPQCYTVFGHDSKYLHRCPFCLQCKVFTQREWMEHIGYHVAEYRYQCPKCYLSYPMKHLLRAHIKNNHGIDTKLSVKKYYGAKCIPKKHIKAYICCTCDYIQLVLNKVRMHCIKQHSCTNVVYSTNDIILLNFESVKKVSQYRFSILEQKLKQHWAAQCEAYIKLYIVREPPAEIVDGMITSDNETDSELEVVTDGSTREHRLEIDHTENDGSRKHLDLQSGTNHTFVQPKTANLKQELTSLPVAKTENNKEDLCMVNSPYVDSALTTSKAVLNDFNNLNVKNESDADIELELDLDLDLDLGLCLEKIVKNDNEIKEICNIGYLLQYRNIKQQIDTVYYCLITTCNFLFSEDINELRDHLMKNHSNVQWDGSCKLCNITDLTKKSFTCIDELQHMLRTHLFNGVETENECNEDFCSPESVYNNTQIKTENECNEDFCSPDTHPGFKIINEADNLSISPDFESLANILPESYDLNYMSDENIDCIKNELLLPSSQLTATKSIDTDEQPITAYICQKWTVPTKTMATATATTTKNTVTTSIAVTPASAIIGQAVGSSICENGNRSLRTKHIWENDGQVNESILEDIIRDTGVPSNSLYMCPIFECTEYLTPHNIHVHMRSHKFVTRLPCTTCKKNYEPVHYFLHLISHLQHRYFCYYCCKTGYSAKNVEDHIIEVHKLRNDLFYEKQLPVTWNDSEKNNTFNKDDKFYILSAKFLNQSEVKEFCVRLTSDWQKRFNVDQGNNERTETEIVYKNTNKSNATKEMISDNRKFLHLNIFELAPYIPIEKIYKCGVEDCYFGSADKQSYLAHLSAVHRKGDMFKCKFCDKPAVWLSHQKISKHFHNHDARLFQCDRCKFLHYDIASLRKHIKCNHSEDVLNIHVIRYTRTVEGELEGQIDHLPAAPLDKRRQLYQLDHSNYVALGKDRGSLTASQLVNGTNTAGTGRSKICVPDVTTVGANTAGTGHSKIFVPDVTTVAANTAGTGRSKICVPDVTTVGANTAGIGRSKICVPDVKTETVNCDIPKASIKPSLHRGYAKCLYYGNN